MSARLENQWRPDPLQDELRDFIGAFSVLPADRSANHFRIVETRLLIPRDETFLKM
jgi:hypothetical protein